LAVQVLLVMRLLLQAVQVQVVQDLKGVAHHQVQLIKVMQVARLLMLAVAAVEQARSEQTQVQIPAVTVAQA
jgi:hypothetical protein